MPCCLQRRLSISVTPRQRKMGDNGRAITSRYEVRVRGTHQHTRFIFDEGSADVPKSVVALISIAM